MSMITEQIVFAQGHYWWLFFIIAGMICCAAWAFYKKRRLIFLLAHERWQKQLVQGYSSWKMILKFIVLVIAYTALGIVFLQPQWGKKKHAVDQKARDIMVALDISRSMLVQDVMPSRLEAAKAKIKQIIDHLPAERFGLVLFAGSSIVQCPLTTDYKAFTAFLDQIGSDTISRGSTSIASALHKVMTLFADQSPTRKVVIVLTDGEDFSEDLSAIKAQAKQDGIALITLGIGTAQGGPIPCIDGQGACTGYQKNEEGSILFSKLDESLLRDIAESVGGLYVHAHEGNADCKAIAQYVMQFERKHFDTSDIEQFENRYSWFAGLAFIALIIEWMM